MNENLRYELLIGSNVVQTSDDKWKFFKFAQQCDELEIPATICDRKIGGIIYENKTQEKINNS